MVSLWFYLCIYSYLFYVTYGQTLQDNFFCGFIASTNIQYWTSDNWSCDVNGFTTSDPCGWVYCQCSNETVFDISINSFQIEGKYFCIYREKIYLFDSLSYA